MTRTRTVFTGVPWRFLSLGVLLVLAACTGSIVSPDSQPEGGGPDAAGSPDDPATDPGREYRIVTLLPRDGIPAIDDPVFLNAQEADAEYAPDEQILGVVFNGEARAYSTSLLSRHEIVNDEVEGVKFAVTW